MNLNIYSQVRSVPKEALKEIQAGRLRGKSDINPMWRIKTLTEQFGPCGMGWKYIITDKRLEQGGNGEIAAFVDIDLFIKVDGEWSEAIPGTGGSMFVANESKGPYVSDECFKMALTDAISVACKALGFGADVYWDKDATKYNQTPHQGNNKPKSEPPPTGQNNSSQGQKNEPTVYCSECTLAIVEKPMAVKAYSERHWGRILCQDCQKKTPKPSKAS